MANFKIKDLLPSMKKTAKQSDVSEEGIQYVKKQDLSNLETFLDTSDI